MDVSEVRGDGGDAIPHRSLLGEEEPEPEQGEQQAVTAQDWQQARWEHTHQFTRTSVGPSVGPSVGIFGHIQ